MQFLAFTNTPLQDGIHYDGDNAIEQSQSGNDVDENNLIVDLHHN
jgi:hypothetical protein